MIFSIFLFAFVAFSISSCSCPFKTYCCGESGHFEHEVTIDRIFSAAQVLEPVIRKTELHKIDGISEQNQVYLKLENNQLTGSFKLRGAYFMMSNLSPEEKVRGVVTCSAGNHAQGVGFAADKFDIAADIFVPSSAPEKKISALKKYKNVTLHLVEGSFDDAKAESLKFQKDKKAVFVPPFDHPNIIAGQGTIGWEIMHQLPDADVVIAAIGGGGLISGIASAVKALNPKCQVIGVEPANAASMYESLRKDEIITLDSADTIADGTAVKEVGEYTFDICKHCVDKVVTVSEEEIERAIKVLKKRYDVTAEGAGALPIAALLADKIQGENLKIVCVISGGNIDEAKLKTILEK